MILVILVLYLQIGIPVTVKIMTTFSFELRLVLKNLKLKNNHRLVIGNLNINSISNKFDNLQLITQSKIDILVITETKTDSTFRLNQFAYKVIRNLTGLIEIEIEVVFLYMFKKIFQVGN